MYWWVRVKQKKLLLRAFNSMWFILFLSPWRRRHVISKFVMTSGRECITSSFSGSLFFWRALLHDIFIFCAVTYNLQKIFTDVNWNRVDDEMKYEQNSCWQQCQGTKAKRKKLIKTRTYSNFAGMPRISPECTKLALMQGNGLRSIGLYLE